MKKFRLFMYCLFVLAVIVVVIHLLIDYNVKSVENDKVIEKEEKENDE